MKPRITYNGRKIGNYFPIKDRIKPEHQSNLTYSYTKNREIRNNNEIDYIGETNVRFGTRVSEHIKQKQSSIHKHATENNYHVSSDDFRILDKGYRNSDNRKIGEALLIKEYKPPLNEQVLSYKLKLFN